MEKKLYIIGNGFDIHHGLKSSYKDFYLWMTENGYAELVNEMDDLFIDNMEWWSDMETALGNINMDYVARRFAVEYYPNYEDESFGEIDRELPIRMIEEKINRMRDNLYSALNAWVGQLYTANLIGKLPLSDLSKFLCFNYTTTLEDVYNVPKEDVLHIHGLIGDANCELLLGHGKTSIKLKNDIEKQGPQPPKNASKEELQSFYEETTDDVIERAKDTTVYMISKFQKPVDALIFSHNDFWKAIRGVTHVYILGYSFSNIDEPYLDKIMSSICKRRVKWTISYYGGRDLERIRTFMEKHHLRNSRVNVVKMVELQNKGQLVIEF